ncbi:MAG: hypothetical protein AAGJ83_02980 [Planctomycetota bacterium]
MSNPFAIIGKQIAGVLLDKQKSDEVYKNLVPAIRYVCSSKGRRSQEATGLLNILQALPASGAKTLNFRKEYIDTPDGWTKLPASPDELPFGYWH